MNTRIFSWFVDRVMTLAVMATVIWLPSVNAEAQTGAGYYTDPATGIVYQKVTKTVERPVVDTQVQQREQTVYRPQTITETKPQSRTVYAPVLEYKWEPRITGRWNPFRQPTVTYYHVPRTHWEARNEVVQRTNTRTEWVAEKRTVEVPQRIVRMQRDQRVDYEVVGRVSPQQAGPQGVSATIASRLRPLDTNTSVQPLNQANRFAGSTFSPPRIAASTVGRLTSDPPRRTTGQGGMLATELTPTASGVRGQALPPVSNGVGVANMRALPFFR
jgi:hypothetical protein